jgi:T5SS/PEP-CTERM-associated repeat protein
MKPTHILARAFALALAAILAPAAALRAADVYWGGGDGVITDDNWYSGTALTTKVIRTGTDVINLPSGTVTIAATATVAETGIGTGDGTHAAVIVNAPGGYWNNTSGELSIGGSAASTIDAGTGTNVSGALTILSGSVRANTFYIGNYGAGTFYLAQGAALNNTANAFLARNAGGSGTATIDGAWTIGATGASNGYLYVGSAAATGARSDNLLTIGKTGAVIVAGTGAYGYIRIGQGISTTGTVIVRGLLQTKGVNAINSIGYTGNNRDASDTAATGYLFIASTGTVIFSGTETTLGHLGFASGATYRANASGTALVDGVWKNAGNLIVGRSGAGYLEIRTGGTVTAATHLSVAAGNSASNANYTAGAGPQGGTLIVDGHLAIGAHALIGAGDATTATLTIGPNGTLRTGANGTGEGYLQIGRNGSTAGSGTAAPVSGVAILQVDGLLDIGGNFNFGMRSKTELTLGAEGSILVSGHHYQSANTLLAFAPGAARDLPLVAAAKTAALSGTLKLTGLDNLAGYTTAAAANAAAASALPGVTVISAAGISGEFGSNTITPALTGTAGLPDYIFNGIYPFSDHRTLSPRHAALRAARDT